MKSKNKSTTQVRAATRNSNVTVRDLADQFGKVTIDTTFSSSNTAAYLQYPDSHHRTTARILCDFVSFTGALPVKDLTAAHAASFLDHVSTSFRSRHGKTLSEPTLLKFAASLSLMFKYGKRQNLCRDNPFRDIETRLVWSIGESLREKGGTRR